MGNGRRGRARRGRGRGVHAATAVHASPRGNEPATATPATQAAALAASITAIAAIATIATATANRTPTTRLHHRALWRRYSDL